MADKVQRRVLIVEPSGNLWGSELVLLDLLSVIPDPRWKIAVCCPPNTPILEQLASVPVQVFPSYNANLHLKSRLARLNCLFALIRLALHFRPDMLYVNQAGATRIALWAGKLLGIPVISHVRLAEDVQYVSSLRASSTTLKKIISVSHYVAAIFNEFPGIFPEKLTVLYDPYTPHCDWNDNSCQTMDMSNPVFCCVGRLAFTKGQDIFIRALAALRHDGIDAGGIILGTAGPGDRFGEELRDLAEKLDVESHIHWGGYQGNVFPFLQKSAALVCPSRKEPLGRVLFEAWDAGVVPIAWAGSGGPAEVLGTSGGGLLYETQDGQCLAEALKKVLGMRVEQRLEMLRNGREWVKRNCDTGEFSHKLFLLWDEAVRLI